MLGSSNHSDRSHSRDQHKPDQRQPDQHSGDTSSGDQLNHGRLEEPESAVGWRPSTLSARVSTDRRPRMNRRSMLGLAAGGFFALAVNHRAQRLFAATPQGRAKRCLVLWMDGGPSQFETFDPKPSVDTGGPTERIATAVPDLQFASGLPELAKRADKLAVLRNVTSQEGDHFRANYYLHTGYRQVPGFPRPALGSVVSHQSPRNPFPDYVTLGARGFGPAFLGMEHAPFAIENAEQALEMLRRLQSRSKRLELIQTMNRTFGMAHPDSVAELRLTAIDQLQHLVDTPFVDALNVDRESEPMRRRYGDTDFGRRCLLARRMLEAGVHYVEVQHGGWDTHVDNFNATTRLCAEIDRPWATLLDDLQATGLLEETLVVWMGEFGRTPVINANVGRDHYPAVTPVVLAGAGVAGGQAIGATNRTGVQIEGQSHSIADLFATIFALLGIDPALQFTTDFDAPTSITEGGRVIDGVMT